MMIFGILLLSIMVSGVAAEQEVRLDVRPTVCVQAPAQAQANRWWAISQSNIASGIKTFGWGMMVTGSTTFVAGYGCAAADPSSSCGKKSVPVMLSGIGGFLGGVCIWTLGKCCEPLRR